MAYRWAVLTRHLLRALPVGGAGARERARASRAVVATLCGRREVPFGRPAEVAVRGDIEDRSAAGAQSAAGAGAP
jgi:hypothetical protein